ncbi:hypothetical protein M9Y10_028883 [Tritrichomonas musculus]|uniref:COPI associated protein n=1 Tax=Tritrichomonas musculus TaxID=1915356 RepID=A0ABR2KLG7_9EUKA
MGIEILSTILQYVAIAAGVFGIIVAFVCIFKYFSVGGLIVDIFVIFFCVCIVLSELYIFDFFKYIAFIVTFWGKGILYLFMGFFLFSSHGIGLVAAIIFWALFALYLIVGFLVKHYNPPLFQKNNQPNFSVSEQDYFGEGGPSAGGNNGGAPQENPPQ